MARIFWGGLPIEVLTAVTDSASPSTAQRIAQGFEGQRIDLMGIIPVKFAGFNGGFVRGSYIHDWRTELNKVAENTGVQTHLDRVAALGWEVVSQAALTAVDHSGFRAANKRVHAAMYNSRFVAAVGAQLFTDTSTSNPALTVPSTADGLSDLITAMGVGQIGSTRALAVAGGTTDDIQYATNPFAADLSAAWTKMVTLSDTPYINWLQYLNIGPGIWVVNGRPSTALGAGVYHFKNDATLPATLSPVVLSDTKDQSNTANATQTTAAVPGTEAISLPISGIGSPKWVNPTNALVDDGSLATSTSVTGPALSADTEMLWISGFDFKSLFPTSGRDIVGLTASIQRSEDNADDNVIDRYIVLGTNARFTGYNSTSNSDEYDMTFVGANKADTASEWPTTEAAASYGGTADKWGAELDALIQRDDFSIGIAVDTAGNSIAEVDYVTLAVSYRLKGTMPIPGLGGFTCGPLPSRPNVIPSVEPESDDLTGVTVRRLLKFYTFSWDAASDRAIVDITYPATGLPNVEDIIPFQGGVLAVGKASSGIGKQVKHVDSQGEVRNYNFPGFHGAESVGIVNGFDLGNSALLDVADEDGGNAQWWLFNDAKYHGSYPQQSSSSAIASLPLAWAERTLHTAQNRIYRFYPVSTTNLAAARSFVPDNIFDDPMVTNLLEPKVTSAYVRTPKFEIGPTENEQSILLIRHLGDQISATGGSWGTVKYEYEVATDTATIDTAFATPPVSTGSLNAPFEEYQVPLSGVSARIVMAKMTLTNAGSSSVKTPNGVPWYTEFKSKPPLRSLWKVPIDAAATAASYTSWTNFVRLLKAKSAESLTQTLQLDSAPGVPAELIGWDGSFEVPGIGQPVVIARGKDPYVLFLESRGTSA